MSTTTNSMADIAEPDPGMFCWVCDAPIPAGDRFVSVDYHVEHVADDGVIDVDDAESIATACTACLPSRDAVRVAVEAIPTGTPPPAACRWAADPETLWCDRCGRVFGSAERHVTLDYCVEHETGRVSISVEEACWLITRCLGCAPHRDAVAAALGLPTRPVPDGAAAVLNRLDRELDEGVLG
jgi:hypothetical protein